jgi:predicted enzyme related to lactoylglutathione lyase
MADGGAGVPAVPKGGGGHPIQWVEARANALERTSEFYGAVFGWELSAFGDSYLVHWREGRLGVGFSAGLREQLPDSLSYVSVTDIDEVTGRAAELGATVFEPKQPIGPDMPNTAMLRNADGVFVGLVDGHPRRSLTLHGHGALRSPSSPARSAAWRSTAAPT